MRRPAVLPSHRAEEIDLQALFAAMPANLQRQIAAAATDSAPRTPRYALDALLAAVDETGEVRALRHARTSGWEQAARPARTSEQRLRNHLSATWLPIMS